MRLQEHTSALAVVGVAFTLTLVLLLTCWIIGLVNT